LNLPVLYDLDARLRIMEAFPDYQQILTLSLPAIENLAGPDDSPRLARIANDGMAEICASHPDRFPGFVASLPMNNVPAALEEMDYAIKTLGARGIQVFTNVNGRPLDDPEFFGVFERAVNTYRRPIWMHPTRGPNVPDYATEKKSKYEIWWAFGWPYETAAAMARIAFSGMLDRLPDMQIITHHLGSFVPYLEARVAHGFDQLGVRTSDEDYGALLKQLGKRPIDYFRMFFADTSLSGSAAGIRCGLDFFGARHVLFGTDCPFDPEGGPMFIRETIRAIDSLGLSPDDRDRIYFRNAVDMLRLGNPAG
jgi:predicted TIM-barrel fold metal-dependent hydrolase